MKPLLSTNNAIASVQAGVLGQLKDSAEFDAFGSSESKASLKNFLRERATDGTRWNKIYPYVLRIGNSSPTGDGGIVESLRPLTNGFSGIAVAAGKKFNSMIGNTNNQITSVVLPISPQNIAISTPAASNLTVTLKGIVEEHNGAPLRSIRISGTSGVNPTKGFMSPSTSSVSLMSDIFRNTISAGKSLLGPETAGISDTSLFQSNQSVDIGAIAPTGYLFFHQLVNFIDQYFYAKKQKANKSMYMVFEMQKDELYYKCSIKSFTWAKRAGTLEYDYNLELTGWAYEKKTPVGLVGGLSSLASTVSTIGRVIATVKKARSILAKARNVIKGLGQDADRIFSIIQEINMAGKDAIALEKSIADMPDNIVKSFKSLVIESKDSLGDAWAELEKSSVSKNHAATQSKIITDQSQRGPNSSLVTSADLRVAQVFADPIANVDFLDAVNLSSLTIPTPLQDQIDSESFRISTLDTKYWIDRRDELVNISNGIANMVGLGSATYNEILGNTGVKSRTRTPRSQEIEILKNLGDLIQQANSFIVMKRGADRSIQNYVDFYVAQAQSNGININSPASKFAVPMPFGSTLQSLAVQYLGDASRWIEIAAINSLRSPFVDEDGFTRAIKGSTNGQIITVSSADDLYVNQPILLTDNTHLPLNARIKKIEIFDNITVFLTLDQDATGYGISTEAQLKAYLPNTVNSNMLIYIPTDQAPTVLANDFKFSPDTADQSLLAVLAGADILLDSAGDIAALPSGDVRVSSGVANLTQAATLKLTTPLGSLVQHPDYGLGVMAGTPTSEFDVNESFGNIERAFATDDRFQSVLASKISKAGNTVTIDIALQLPNTDSILPLTVNLRQ